MDWPPCLAVACAVLVIASDRNGSDLGFASVPLSFAADATAPPATPTAVEPRFTAEPVGRRP